MTAPEDRDEHLFMRDLRRHPEGEVRLYVDGRLLSGTRAGQILPDFTASSPASIDASPSPASVDPAAIPGPYAANLGDGANGRLSEAECDLVLEAVWSWEEAAEGVMAEDVVLPVVERIVREHTERALAEVEQERDAFKRQYNVGFREWQQAHTEAAREKARADALAEQVAAVGALADRLEAPATKMQIISADPAPPIRRAIGSELRAALATPTTPDAAAGYQCPDCAWQQKPHPAYGWQRHDERAVEVHKTQLCPARAGATTTEGDR